MEQENNQIIWVRGNTQPLIIPLEQEVMTQSGEFAPEPYYPSGNAEVIARFQNMWGSVTYTPAIDGNLLIFTDNALLEAGCYDVEVIVKNPDGTQYRSQWDNQVVVTDSNPSVLQEWDEFKNQEVKARAALFFFAKGDKGDTGETGATGQQGPRGFTGDCIYPVFDVTEEMHLVSDEGADRMNISESGHLTIDY